jgi:hypothetical protein
MSLTNSHRHKGLKLGSENLVTPIHWHMHMKRNMIVEEKHFFLTRVAVTTSKHVQLHTTDHDVPSIELKGHRSLNGAHCWNA